MVQSHLKLKTKIPFKYICKEYIKCHIRIGYSAICWIITCKSKSRGCRLFIVKGCGSSQLTLQRPAASPSFVTDLRNRYSKFVTVPPNLSKNVIVMAFSKYFGKSAVWWKSEFRNQRFASGLTKYLKDMRHSNWIFSRWCRVYNQMLISKSLLDIVY